MKIEPYSHEVHLPRLKSWLAAKGVTLPPLEMFSTMGYCVDDVAIGFLFPCFTAPVAWIDNIAADPAVEKGRRDAALKALIVHLELKAQQGLKKVCYFLAGRDSMRLRLVDLGWECHGEYGLYFKAGGNLCHG